MKWQTGSMTRNVSKNGGRRVHPLVVIAAAIAVALATLPTTARGAPPPCGADNTCNSIKVAVVNPPDSPNSDTFGVNSSCGGTVLYSCTRTFSTTPTMTLLDKCEAIRSALATAPGTGCANYTFSLVCDITNPAAPFFTVTDTFTLGAVVGFQAINFFNVVQSGQQGSVFLNDYEEDMISSNTDLCPAEDPNGDGDAGDAIIHQFVLQGTGDDSKISPGTCVGGSNDGGPCRVATECPSGGSCVQGHADVECTVDETANGHGVTTVSVDTDGKPAELLAQQLSDGLQLNGVNVAVAGKRGIRIRPRPGDLHKLAIGCTTDNFKIHTDNRSGAEATIPLPTEESHPAQSCLPGKINCVSKKKSCLLGVEAKARSKGALPDPLALQKCKDKFDGGLTPAKGCFAKLEAKNKGPCVTFGDNDALEAKVDAFVDDVVSELDSNPANDQNKCTAGKLKCVANKDKCILKVQAKAAKLGVPADSIALQKCKDKFDGGLFPEKGCFAKLEAKPGCLTLGDTTALENKVDAFDADVMSELRP